MVPFTISCPVWTCCRGDVGSGDGIDTPQQQYASCRAVLLRPESKLRVPPGNNAEYRERWRLAGPPGNVPYGYNPSALGPPRSTRF